MVYITKIFTWATRRALDGAHVPPTGVSTSHCLSEWNHFKTTSRCSGQHVYVVFSQRKIPHSRAGTIAEKAIWFQHPDYNPDQAQKLISSSMSRHLSTRNISSKSMHAFFEQSCSQTDRQTDRQTRANAFTSCFVGGNKNGQ